MIKLGQKVRFNPWHGQRGFADCDCNVDGTVIYVHPAHHYFTVVYELGPMKHKFKTSFHFADVYGKYRYVKVVS